MEQKKAVWDPKTVEIRTRSVEKSLEPLVRQVTTLVNHYNAQHKRGRCSKKGPQLVRDIEVATKRLVEVAECIADDFIEIQEPMLEACSEAKEAGDIMQLASREFASDPCNSSKRSSMVRAARALLSSVARLLCVADMADVQRLLASLKQVDDHLKYLVNIDDMDELLSTFKLYGDDLIEVTKQTSQRQADLKDPLHQDEMAAARATLQNSSKLLLTASKAYVSHPDSDSAHENRDFVINKLNDAVSTIANVAQSFDEGEQHPFKKCGLLANTFHELLELLEQEELDGQDARLDLKCLVEEVVEESCNIAESTSSNDTMMERIFAACRNVEDALSNIFYILRNEKENQIIEVEDARYRLKRRIMDLSQQVKKCIVDIVVDLFLWSDVPLNLLVEAAELGDVGEVEDCSIAFEEHSDRLSEVTDLACCVCGNAEGIKMVKISAQQLLLFTQQVVNAAKTMAKHPRSKPARENMFMFRDTWLEQLKILIEAVDDITVIDDFLVAAELRILEDINHCINAIHKNDMAKLNEIAGTVCERIMRIDAVILAEIESIEAGVYKDNIRKCLHGMKENVLPQFLKVIDNFVHRNHHNGDKDYIIDSTQLVYECMKDIRKSVTHRDLVDDSGTQYIDEEEKVEEEQEECEENMWYKEESHEPKSETEDLSSDYYTPNAQTASALMRSLSKEQKVKMKELVDGLLVDTDRLTAEVDKWNEQGNEILVLAKRMCVIMTDLSDFARGRGVLKTTMDVIKAAERIANYGLKMKGLVIGIAERCPYSRTKSDLFAYLEKISLYSHQLTMTSRVKADVELQAVMEPDSAKSLIQAARNLMSSVISTIRTSYIASTKHRSESYSGVKWRMRLPDTKSFLESKYRATSTKTEDRESSNRSTLSYDA